VEEDPGSMVQNSLGEKGSQKTNFWVVAQFNKEASQTRDYCVAKCATLRAARPDSSLRKSACSE
jgi:hypothetical protein